MGKTTLRIHLTELNCDDDESAKDHTRLLREDHDVELRAGARKIATFPKRA